MPAKGQDIRFPSSAATCGLILRDGAARPSGEELLLMVRSAVERRVSNHEAENNGSVR
jgi:hypothetical protein